MKKEKKDKAQANGFSPIAEKFRSSSPKDVMSGFELAFCALQQGRLSLPSQLLISLFHQLVGIDWTHTLDVEGLKFASDYYQKHLINTAESLEGIARVLREAAQSDTSHKVIDAQLDAEIMFWPVLENYGYLIRNLEVAARHYQPTESYISSYSHLLRDLADEIEAAGEDK